jgi:hypothetical protein
MPHSGPQNGSGSAKEKTLMKANSAAGAALVVLVCGSVFVQRSGALMADGHPPQATKTKRDCKVLRGTEVDLYDLDTNISRGKITDSGDLDGRTVWAFPPQVPGGFVATADPDVVSYWADLTITTRDGRMQTRTITMQNTNTARPSAYAAFGYIDGSASTGRFAGATGEIFFNSYLTPPDFYLGPFTNTIVGQICFAR